MTLAEVLLNVLLAAAATALLWTVVLFADGLRILFATMRRKAAARPLRLDVVARDDPTLELFHVRLAGRGLRPLPAFRPGQAVMIRTPAGQRMYSLAGWQPEPGYWELAIRNQGRVSGWLHAHAVIGRRLELSVPRGSFVLDGADKAPVVLVGAGVGITPLRAMLHRLRDLPAPPPVTLWHACRREGDLLWRDEFEALAARAEWFCYRPVLSRPNGSWPGEQGRLDAARLRPNAHPEDTRYYLCASAAMMDELAAKLAAAGVEAALIHREAFGVSASADGPSHELMLPDGRCVAATEGVPLLAVLEEHGCAPVAECRAGECGCCLVQLRGPVRYLLEPAFAVPDGQVAACCATASGRVELTA